ncbi:FAD-binding protein [Candidatus Bathyarchaeota archaeon]|nr:FAD-binding protein [Candidatus Bathyarchaeota archaeon]
MKTAVSLQNLPSRIPNRRSRVRKPRRSRRSSVQLDRVVARLPSIVGGGSVLTDRAELVCYSYDASCYSRLPDVVVFPNSSEEISKIVRLANRERVPVTPRGAGTSLSGGPVPARGGIVVVLARMNRILDLDEDNLTVTCEVGLTLRDLNRSLARKLLHFPIDPGSSEAATLGGMIGENASGMHSPRFGKTKDRVLSLEVVLPNGDIIHVGSKCFKSASGYNLKELFIGSEGTLGIVTKATLRLSPLPDNYTVISASFKTTVAAGRAISRVVKRGLPVSALEFMDRPSIEVVKAFTGLPLPQAAAMVLIECTGPEGEVQNHLADAAEILREEGAFELRISSDRGEADRLWHARKVTYGAISRIRPTAIQADPVVPVSKLPDYLARLDLIAQKYALKIVSYGHAADGNLHPTVLIDEGNPEEMRYARMALAEIYQSALELGGTLTGEHGVGVEKSDYFNLEWPSNVVSVMREIKAVLDPNNIMNPRKWI